MKPSHSLFIIAALAALGGCAHKDHDLDESGGVKIKQSSCPAVSVPVGTGDITLFNPANSRDARAIDVVANITNVRATCSDINANDDGSHHKRAQESQATGNITSSATFDVQARRSDASGARDVVLPYFSVVMQGGNIVISKRVSQIALHFNAGEYRASSSGSAGANIDRAAATLPLEIINRVNKRRKTGDEDAAIDPLADPAVRDQIARSTFELLVGFQLNNGELQYNATR